MLIRVAAAAVAAVAREPTDSAIIILVLLGSALLTLVQEYRATTAVARLRARIVLRSTVLREELPAEQVDPKIVVHAALDPHGQASPEVLAAAVANARLQTGLHNPLDEALLTADPGGIAPAVKVDEIPYDFLRRRVTIVVEEAMVLPDGFVGMLLIPSRRASAHS